MSRWVFLSVTMMVVALCLATVECGAQSDGVAPKVIATNPPNGAVGVDPSLSEISVTFNRPMMDGSWSWAYEQKNKFPQGAGEPSYTDDFTRCVLPVKLQPDKEYVIWINTADHKNFRDQEGNPAEPYKWTFRTR